MNVYLIYIACIIWIMLSSGCNASITGNESMIDLENSVVEEEIDIFLTDGYLPDYDAQNQFSWYKNAAIIKNTVFFKYGSMLYFYDENSRSMGPLCGRAECMHDNGTCNAYIGDSYEFCYYNEKLYWAEKDYKTNKIFLSSMNLDGSEHTIIQEIPQPFQLNSSESSLRIHRGYVYMAEVIDTIEEGREYHNLYLGRMELEDKKSEVDMILEKKVVFGTGVDFWLNFWGNEMYFLERDFDSGNIEKGTTGILYQYDIHESELVRVSEEIFLHETPWDFLVTSNGIYISVFNFEQQTFYDKRILKFDAETATWVTIAEIPDYHTGEPFLLHQNIMAAAWGMETPRYTITDFEGNIVRSGDLPLMEGQERVSVVPMAATDQFVLFDVKPHVNTGGTESMILVPMDPEEELQVLCS